MATIKDVAQLAGVSVTTVSRVINDRGYLSDKVKKQVQDAMQALDYYPNDLARALNHQKSYSFGLIIPTVAHPFFGEIALAMETYAYTQGYKITLCNSCHDIEKERDYIAMLRRNQVDGIIMGSHLIDVQDYIGHHLPLVTLDREISSAIPYVSCDNYVGGELAARHLIESGCRNLVHMCGNLKVPMLSNQRTDALKKVCKENGIHYAIYEAGGSFVDEDQECQWISQILKENPDCDGIFATSDPTASRVIQTAALMGKDVPQDLKVVGFDGSKVFKYFSPSLTTIKQPVEMISKYAIQYLIDQINGETVPSKTILPVELYKGGST